MVFFSKKLDIEVTEKIIDSDGRFILLKCIVQGTKILLYNVYAPNNEKEHVTFLLSLKDKLESLDTNDYEYMRETGTSLLKKMTDQGEITITKNGRKAHIF